MRKIIIGIAGPAGAGKSTAARLLQQEAGHCITPFAGPLKRMALAYGLTPEEISTGKESPLDRDWPLLDWQTAKRMLQAMGAGFADVLLRPTDKVDYLCGRSPAEAMESLVAWHNANAPLITTPRHFLQRLGTEWGREMIGGDVWIRCWNRDIMASAVEHFGDILVVSDDVRFPNEADAIRAHGGIVVRIERDGSGSATGSGHASETTQVRPDITIWNDGPECVLAARMSGVLDRYFASEAV
jgi:hypothetical protein